MVGISTIGNWFNIGISDFKWHWSINNNTFLKTIFSEYIHLTFLIESETLVVYMKQRPFIMALGKDTDKILQVLRTESFIIK